MPRIATRTQRLFEPIVSSWLLGVSCLFALRDGPLQNEKARRWNTCKTTSSQVSGIDTHCTHYPETNNTSSKHKAGPVGLRLRSFKTLSQNVAASNHASSRIYSNAQLNARLPNPFCKTIWHTCQRKPTHDLQVKKQQSNMASRRSCEKNTPILLTRQPGKSHVSSAFILIDLMETLPWHRRTNSSLQTPP